MSGDGGWAGLDQDVAAALTARGIPVVGLDSLRYYWTPRTPAGLAADTDRMIRYYLAHFAKQRVLLIGYSQGADVLPFAVNRLSAATRAHVALTAVMGMSEHALFEFHLTNWVADDNSGPATLPEIDRITGMPVLCIYGADEKDSLCPKLDPNKFRVVRLKGGHHFDGDYAGLAGQILAAANP
jgi:type IV secretory pathway VirJ component